MNYRSRQFGVRTSHHHNNGDPVDFIDAACRKAHFRTECIEHDLREGNYPNLREGIYPQRSFHDPGPDIGMTFEQRFNICKHQNISYYGEDLANLLIWEWQDQCAKLKLFECGTRIDFAWHLDDQNEFHCGYPENPDYINGTPLGNECDRDMCLIVQQWGQEIIDGLKARGYGPESYNITADNEVVEQGGLWKYLRERVDNYLVYANHPEIICANNTCDPTKNKNGYSSKRSNTEREQFPTPWDMNRDEAGNTAIYFPYDWTQNFPSEDYKPYNSLDVQYIPHDHWNAPYSVATQRCRLPPTTTLLGPGDRQCCGEQPNRVPFQNSRHECCAGQLQGIGSCGAP